MLIRLLILFVFLLPLKALADSVELKSIVSAVTGDFDNDGIWDRAILVGHEDEGIVDLYIHSEKNEYLFEKIAWSGVAAGMVPKLKISDNAQLEIVSQNMAIGRHKWFQVLTIAHVDGEFVPSTLLYESFDGLDPSAEQTCEIDFLKGAVINSSEKFSVPKGAHTLNDWRPEVGVSICAGKGSLE
jgi:hypothetical protein